MAAETIFDYFALEPTTLTFFIDRGSFCFRDNFIEFCTPINADLSISLNADDWSEREPNAD